MVLCLSLFITFSVRSKLSTGWAFVLCRCCCCIIIRITEFVCKIFNRDCVVTSAGTKAKKIEIKAPAQMAMASARHTVHTHTHSASSGRFMILHYNCTVVSHKLFELRLAFNFVVIGPATRRVCCICKCWSCLLLTTTKKRFDSGPRVLPGLTHDKWVTHHL